MNKKKSILLTAFRMFAEQGYDGVSLNNIIKETGLTKGGVYYHFSGKEELFKEVVEMFILHYFTGKVRDRVDTKMEKSIVGFSEFDWKEGRGLKREERTETICWNCKEVNQSTNLVCIKCGASLKTRTSS